MTNLPPGVEPLTLPECALYGGMTVNKRGRYASTEDGYTADQMREHEAKAAQAGFDAGLEAAAKLCEQSQWSYVVPAIRSLKGSQ